MKNHQNYVEWSRTRVRMCTGGKFNYASYISSKMLKLSLIHVSNVHFKYFVEEITWKELLHSVVLCKHSRILRIRLWSMFYHCQVNFRLKAKVKFLTMSFCTNKKSKADISMLMCTPWMMHCQFHSYIRTSNSYHIKVKFKIGLFNVMSIIEMAIWLP